MVHQYLKTCVLSVCVAVSCGDRAFGAWFACKECNQAIEEEHWGSHNVKFQHGNEMPEWFVCNRCCIDKNGAPKTRSYHYRETSIHFNKDANKGGGKCEVIPSFEEHVEQQHHRVWEYAFWCPKCRWQIGVNSWIMHLYRECKCYDEIYKSEGSGLEKETFQCLLCKEKGKEAVFPLILKYEHLRDNHCDRLPERKFFCKSCKETVSEANWQEHRKEKHETIDEFYCFICKEIRRECYEAHMATYHAGQCSFPFCQEEISEEKRGEHMRNEHGFPCPICGKQIDTLLEVHVGREHPCFEGRCGYRKLRRDSNGIYCYKPCEWPCYRVSGWNYIQHLKRNVHEVGRKGENEEAFFEWCPRCDFVGQRDAFKKHVNLKHKDYSFDCPKCQKMDVWRNKEQHCQVEHEKTHWWCMDCAKVFPYQSEVEKERSASRNEHLLTAHKDIYAKCPGCDDVMRIEKLGSHVREKHPKKSYFWCSLCGEYREGVQLEHVGKPHYYCKICETRVVSDPSDHHNEKHKGCFFCRLCSRSFKDRAEHIKSVHPDAKCVCGGCLLSYEVYESWHVAKHPVKCPLCNEIRSSDHMVTAHKCEEGVCEPIANTKELTWKWQCDPSCKNLIKPCPLERKGCKFTGSAEQLTVHMREAHKCEETCRFNESKDFVHGASCRNGSALCSLCMVNVENRELHWVNKHGCREGCPVASGSGQGHSFYCKKWVGTCPVCGEENTDHEHRKKEHGCTEACVLSQSTEKDGIYISVKHCAHKNNAHKNNKTDGRWVFD